MPRDSKASEIDDIFAKPASVFSKSALAPSKGKGKAGADAASAGAVRKTEDSKSKNKKKKKIAKPAESHSADSSHNTSTASNTKRKRREPETVVDSSTVLPSPAKRLKADRSGKSTGARMDDEQRFRDSRGTGPRKKTDEGFSIYKEDELGIRDEGGDTPLCPFDCDCCF